jgi:TPR repeat protein
MKDPYYLPVPPIFALVHLDEFGSEVLEDLLSFPQNSTSAPPEFSPASLFHRLHTRDSPDEVLASLDGFCNRNVSQACLILGRIHEFGAYNQTEDLTKALVYYDRVSDTSAFAPLSFLHRHYNVDLPTSVVEADLSLSCVESRLPAALEHDKGFLRPISCSQSFTLLLPVARAVLETHPFPVSSRLNESTIASLQNSTDPADLHRLAMHALSLPYPAAHEISSAKHLLKLALAKGHHESAAPLAYIYGFNFTRKSSISHAWNILAPALALNDPFARSVGADLLRLADPNNAEQLGRSIRLFHEAASSGYPYALYRLALFAYYGLFGTPRSASAGFELFARSAAGGYQPAMLEMAKMLFSGDGVAADCGQANALLRRIIDSGPWSEFLGTYVEKGSQHAFTKMLDMNLTPVGALQITEQSESTEALIKVLRDSSSVLNSGEAMRRAREAATGNGAAALWLAIKSPIEEAVARVEEIERMRTTFAILGRPLRLYLFVKGVSAWMTGTLSNKGIEALGKMMEGVWYNLMLLGGLLCLYLLIRKRIDLTMD